MRPRVTNFACSFCLVGLYQECPNYSTGVKFGSAPGFTSYTPVEDGTYYVITRGRRAGGVPHSLSGAYLQDYASYGYETSWVDRSHQGGGQCTGTITRLLNF